MPRWRNSLFGQLRMVMHLGVGDAFIEQPDVQLVKIKPDALIIDPLINVMGGVSANENAAVALLMGQLVGLRRQQLAT
jgi:hypothetical protein